MKLNFNLASWRTLKCLALAFLLTLGAVFEQTASGQMPTTAPANASGAAGANPNVTIIREKDYINPKKYITLIRDYIAKCHEARLAAGLADTPDPISEQEILQLEWYRIEERFSGGRYFKDKRYNSFDDTWMQIGHSCTPKVVHYRTVDIKTICKGIFISYDLDKGTGNREEINVCLPLANNRDKARGEVQTVMGGQKCRWNVPKDVIFGRGCLLEPMQKDAYGREMLVQTEIDEKLMKPPVTVVELALWARLFREKLVNLDVGSPIAESYFEAPADSNNFPRKVVK